MNYISKCKLDSCQNRVELFNGFEYDTCSLHRSRMKKYGTYDLWRPCKECGSNFEITGKRYLYCDECLVIYLQCTLPNITTGKGRNLIHARYGLTPFQFYALWQNQKGRCKLCGMQGVLPAKWDKATKLVVDHDHSCCPGRETCGKCIRGLICDTCNLILGHYEKRKSFGYLEIEQFDKYLLERVIIS